MATEYGNPEHPFTKESLSDCFFVKIDGKNGTRIQYIDKKPIGKGGYSTVHHAFDSTLSRAIAVKIIPVGRNELHMKGIVQEEHQKAIHAEIKVQKSIDRYAVPPYFAYTLHAPQLSDSLYPSQVFNTHEYICVCMHALNPKDNIENLSQSGYQFPLHEVLDIGIQCADALDYFAQNELIYREWKPKNLFWQNHRSLRVVDFGVSNAVIESAPIFGCAGTMAVISPEQYANPGWSDIRSDMYSIGCTMYQCIVGDTPFEYGLDPYYDNDGLDAGTQEPLLTALATMGVSSQVRKGTMDFFNQCFRNRLEDRFSSGLQMKTRLQKLKELSKR